MTESIVFPPFNISFMLSCSELIMSLLTGVLDPDELALVNQTFKKPVTPKQGSHKKPALASKFLNSSGIPKMSFSPIRSHKSIDSKPNPSCDQSPLSRSGTISNRPDMQNDTAKGFNHVSKSILS